MDIRKLLLVPLLFFFIFAAAAPVCDAEEMTPSEKTAVQAYRQGAFTRAVNLYTQALTETTDPEHRARLHVNIAWTLFALGRTDEVDTHLNAALLEYPQLNLIPDYYTREFLDRFEQARKNIEMRASGELVAPDLEATLASVEDRIKNSTDLEGALADVNTLLKDYPLDGRLLPIKVQILTMMGRTEEATQLSQGHGEGVLGGQDLAGRLSIPDLILRANSLLEQDDPQGALELLRRAVGRQPSNVAALELMAEAAQQAERWQEAEFALKSALTLQPENLGLNLRLGEIYLARDDVSAARDVFRRLTEEFPRSDRAWAALGLLDARLGNIGHGEEELARGLEENPLLPEIQLAYGELLLKRGQDQEALDSFNAAANLLQNDAQVEGRIGQALLSMGNSSAAVQHLRTAIDGGFKPPDIQRSLALALVEEGQLLEGKKMLEDIGPGPKGDGRLVEALFFLKRDEADKALSILQKLANDRSSEPLVLNLLGVAYYRIQNYSEAKKILSRAAEMAPDNELIGANLQHAQAALTAVKLQENAKPVRKLAQR